MITAEVIIRREDGAVIARSAGQAPTPIEFQAVPWCGPIMDGDLRLFGFRLTFSFDYAQPLPERR